MLILLESAVLCLVFTALIVPFTLKNPAASIAGTTRPPSASAVQSWEFSPPAAAASPKRTCCARALPPLFLP